VSLAALVLVLVALQRVGELALARRNTGRLLARGATEAGAGHYPLLVAVHAAWLITLWVFGRDHPVNLFALAGFIVLQGLRLWIIVALGPRWTTRIMVIPGEPLISSGPYKYLSHPNYAVVAAEIAVLPLAFHLPLVALVFTLVNAAVLGIRIRAEAGALSAIAGPPARAVP
jgi:methyltransferase